MTGKDNHTQTENKKERNTIWKNEGRKKNGAELYEDYEYRNKLLGIVSVLEWFDWSHRCMLRINVTLYKSI